MTEIGPGVMEQITPQNGGSPASPEPFQKPASRWWDLESALEPPSPRGDKPSAMAAMDITKDSKMMDLYSRQIGAFGVGVMSKLVQARARRHTRAPT